MYVRKNTAAKIAEVRIELFQKLLAKFDDAWV